MDPSVLEPSDYLSATMSMGTEIVKFVLNYYEAYGPDASSVDAIKLYLGGYFSPEQIDLLFKIIPTLPKLSTMTQSEAQQIIMTTLACYGFYTLSRSILGGAAGFFSIKNLMRWIPYARTKLKSEVSTQVHGMLNPVMPYAEQLKEIPSIGLQPKLFLEHCDKICGQDVKPNGTAFAYVYETGNADINKTIDTVFQKFSNTNALSPMAFPSLRYMENCITSACAKLLNLPNTDHTGPVDTGAAGVVTSGGTESIICALKAYRDRAAEVLGITSPEIIAPITIHPAFTKGAHLLGITIHLIPLLPQKGYQVDMKKYASYINKNTILLIGSAPAYPHGIIDPIEEICKLSIYRRIPVHVDACIGGFFLPFVEMLQKDDPTLSFLIPSTPSPSSTTPPNSLPTPLPNSQLINPFFSTSLPIWDFRLPQVTSISLDLHKYAYSPKGSSCIMYRTPELRKYQYFSQSNWPGGLFVSPSLLGTRGGGSIAASWASLQLYGIDGYKQLTKDVLIAKKGFIEAVLAFPELEIIGTPLSSIISWKVKDSFTTQLNILSIGDALEKDLIQFKDQTTYTPAKKWKIERQQAPDSIHMTLMAQHIHTHHEFRNDLAAAIKYVKENLDEMKGKGSAGMYGMVVNVSKVSPVVIEEFLTEFESLVMTIDKPI
jgi:sphinganine-1-phosphate aldolase